MCCAKVYKNDCASPCTQLFLLLSPATGASVIQFPLLLFRNFICMAFKKENWQVMLSRTHSPSTQEAQVGGFWSRGLACAMWWNFREGTKAGKTAIKQVYLFLFPRSPSFIFSLAFFPFSVLHNYYFSLHSSRSLLNLSTLDSAKERNRNLYVMIPTVLPSILLDVFRHTFNI